jgi:hypothetical protein
MRPPSYMQSIVERNVVMWRIHLHQAIESPEGFVKK